MYFVFNNYPQLSPLQYFHISSSFVSLRSLSSSLPTLSTMDSPRQQTRRTKPNPLGENQNINTIEIYLFHNSKIMNALTMEQEQNLEVQQTLNWLQQDLLDEVREQTNIILEIT